MKDIDHVECMLAVIGIRPIISKEVEKVTMAQAREALELPKTIYAKAYEVVCGDKFKVPRSGINYKKMLIDINEKYNEAQMIAMVEKFPPALHALRDQFIAKAQEVVKLLQSLFPMQTKTTMLGPENIAPPMLAVKRFVTSLDVLDNPLTVLEHIACGSLLKSQTVIMEEVYPTLSEAITDALIEAATREKAKAQSFRLPAKVNVGYGIWTGVPRVTPALQKRLQDNFAKAKEKKDSSPAGQSGTATSVVAKEALTPTQQGLFPQAAGK